MRKFVNFAAPAAALLALAGCEVNVDNQSRANLDNAAEAVGSAVEGAAGAVENGADAAADKIENVADRIDNRVDVNVDLGGHTNQAATNRH
jgi:hypothetical protein